MGRLLSQYSKFEVQSLECPPIGIGVGIPGDWLHLVSRPKPVTYRETTRRV